MHELGIASAALEQTLAQLRLAGGTRVARIQLRVGALSGVDAEALRFAFTAILPGTPAAAAVVEVDPVAAVACCPACQREFIPGDDLLFECPACGRPTTALTHGRELELTRLVIE